MEAFFLIKIVFIKVVRYVKKLLLKIVNVYIKYYFYFVPYPLQDLSLLPYSIYILKFKRARNKLAKIKKFTELKIYLMHNFNINTVRN